MAPINDKMKETRLRWFGYVSGSPEVAPIHRVERLQIASTIRRRIQPKMWRERIKKYMNT